MESTKPKPRTRNITAKVDAKPILPEDENWSVMETGRGRRHNHVSEALNEMLRIAVSRGHVMFQLKVDEPFTITQVRYWAKKRNGRGPDEFDALLSVASDPETYTAVQEANHIQVGMNEAAGKIQVQLVYRDK